MGNRIFQVAVLLLWMSAMGWLVVAKVMPPFFQGEPPRAGVAGKTEPVGWRIELLGRPCGVSVTQAVEGALDTKELHSRVQLDKIPLLEIAPQWMQSLLQNLGEIRLDLRNRATFDSLGSLSSFHTKVDLNEVDSVIRMYGRVRDGSVRLRVQTGEYVRQSEHPWRESSLLGGQLSPEPKLIDVYVGRRWREEVFSPFGSPGSPAELVEAEVVHEEQLLHEGELLRVKKIVYRSLTPAGVTADDRVRAEVWVREDGVVIRQDSHFMNVRLRLTRMDDEEAALTADKLLDLDRFATISTPLLFDGVGDEVGDGGDAERQDDADGVASEPEAVGPAASE